MYRSPLIIGLVACSLAACEQARLSLSGPTSPSVAAVQAASSGVRNSAADLGEEEVYGSIYQNGEHHSASTDSGFVCGIVGFGRTTDSHATISDSGNQNQHCRTDAPVAPPTIFKLEGFPCLLHFGGVTFDSQLTVTPSGEVHLVCQSK